MMAIVESSTQSPQLAVLLVAYRRAANLSQIIETCAEAGIKNLYVTIDYPRGTSSESVNDHQSVKNVVLNCAKQFYPNLIVHSRVALSNQGSAVSVVSGCEWAFKEEENLIVIEDDCLPTRAFFDFCKSNLKYLNNAENAILICGTQFAPKRLVGDQALFSKYPLTWGWCTNKTSWSLVRDAFRQNYSTSLLCASLATSADDAFWRAGSRRALGGFTDVWDTILVEFMLRTKYLAILPPRNLVINNGNDAVATHISRNSEWTNVPVSANFEGNGLPPIRSNETEEWIRDHCYKIKFRHFFTTKFTLLVDTLRIKPKRFNDHLRKRLEANSFINF